MRVSVAERARLSVLIGRRAFRSLIGRINAHPLVRWRFASTKTDRLVIAPQDLRTADATRASEIYAGRFAFAGKVVICDLLDVEQPGILRDHAQVGVHGIAQQLGLRDESSEVHIADGVPGADGTNLRLQRPRANNKEAIRRIQLSECLGQTGKVPQRMQAALENHAEGAWRCGEPAVKILQRQRHCIRCAAIAVVNHRGRRHAVLARELLRRRLVWRDDQIGSADEVRFRRGSVALKLSDPAPDMGKARANRR